MVMVPKMLLHPLVPEKEPSAVISRVTGSSAIGLKSPSGPFPLSRVQEPSALVRSRGSAEPPLSPPPQPVKARPAAAKTALTNMALRVGRLCCMSVS